MHHQDRTKNFFRVGFARFRDLGDERGADEVLAKVAGNLTAYSDLPVLFSDLKIAEDVLCLCRVCLGAKKSIRLAGVALNQRLEASYEGILELFGDGLLNVNPGRGSADLPSIF